MYLSTKLSMNPSKNFQEVVRICKEYVMMHLSKGYKLSKRAENPFSFGYSPELDEYPAFGSGEASCYQYPVQEMTWMVAICCIYINAKVSLLTSYVAMPCKGHSKSTLHDMDYLKFQQN